MDNQIFGKLQDAENTLQALKELIAQQGGSSGGRRSGGGGTRKNNDQSNSSLSTRRYMTLSTVKLFDTRGSEVFRITDSVGLFFIVPNNRVKTAARSAILRIVRLAEEYVDASHPPAYIQVGEWVYPLMPGSMVYKSEHNYYLFPDLLATVPGSSVGVVLPKSCTQEKRAEYESLLLELVKLNNFPSKPSDFGPSTDLILSARTSVSLVKTNSGLYSQRSSQVFESRNGNGGFGKRLGAGFKAGGELLSQGVKMGAQGTANIMTVGTRNIKSTLPRSGNQCEIPGVIVEGASYARDLTSRVLDLSSAIMASLTKITANLAHLTACYIKCSTAPLVNKALESTGVSQSTVDQIISEIKDIGEGIVAGGFAAYAGMEEAANILAAALNNNTVEIISHCYGPSAAEILQNAGEVFGNVALTGMTAGQVMNAENVIDTTSRQAGHTLAFNDCNHQH